MFKKRDVFEKIDKYLKKKTHENIMSVYLDGYNGNCIFVRLDYVKCLSVYKVVWFDLNFFNDKIIDDYLNIQIVTKILANNLIEMIDKFVVPEKEYLNDDIIGDRVVIDLNIKYGMHYVFDRFLPLEWEFLIDPLVIIFSYLPKSMEVFLKEMFAKFDGVEENYNLLKPFKFDLLEGDLKEIFKPNIISRGLKAYKDGCVNFLEKRDDRYIAIVDDNNEPYVVIITVINEMYVKFWCDCLNEGFCKHLYSVIMAIRNDDYNSFYKIKCLSNTNNLLDKVTKGIYSLCFGVDGDSLLVIDDDARVKYIPIVSDGKVVVKVLEDDDDLSLSKFIDRYKKKS